MPARYEDWLRQAKRDLELAKGALDSGHYEWARFAAQQSAEKGVKALFPRANGTAWAHSVAALLQQLPAPWRAGGLLVNAAKELDKHDIPARYPNSYPQGTPYDYYTRVEAERAIGHTTHILAFCECLCAEPRSVEDMSEEGRSAPGGDTSGD